MRFVYAFLSFILLFMICFCARQSSPVGGLKDETAPKATKSDPVSMQTNVQTNKISITFDEYVTIKNAKEEIVISPLLKNDYKLFFKGKALFLKFDEELKENTTYSINFGNAVVDITEANPVENLNYVFSTGNNIDTLKVEGRVIDASTGLIPENTTAMLYESLTDSLLFKEKPNYIAKLDETGKFVFNNLPNKTFALAFLQEENNNLIADNIDEKIGFVKDAFKPSDIDTNLVKANLFNFAKPKSFAKPKVFNSSFQIALLDSIEVKASLLNQNTELKSELNYVKDSLRFFFNNLNEEDIDAIIVYSNSKENDTISLAKTSTEELDSFVLIKRFLPNEYKNQFSKIRFNQALQFRTEHPIKSFDKNGFSLLSLRDSVVIETEVKQLKEYQRVFEISGDFSPAQKLQLQIDSASITNIFDRVNKPAKINLNVVDSLDYAKIVLKFLNQDSTANYYSILKNELEEILNAQTVPSDSLVYSNLFEGNYSVQIFKDQNSNGKYDNGNYALKLQPERYFSVNEGNPLKIKGGLDVEIEIDLKE